MNEPEVVITPEEFERRMTTRRRDVIDTLAALMYKADFAPLHPPMEFDRSAPTHQRYVRMAEVVFDWSMGRAK